MTKEMLAERIKEEHADAELYHKMALECQEFRQIFQDIAEEEDTHAELMEHIMSHKTW